MARLYCKKHGREREADIIKEEREYIDAGETILVISGRLVSGVWLCDRCNEELDEGDEATLTSCFPRHYRDTLINYDFAYERQYFDVQDDDEVTSYGIEWPDDAIDHCRCNRHSHAA